jgi:hypothetical protein
MCNLSANSRANGSRRTRWWIHVVGYGILFTILGQSVSAGERLQLDTFSVYPPQPKIELDLDDGSTCSVTDRSPPTLVFYGKQLHSLDQSVTNSPGAQRDIGGGVALIIPIGGNGLKQTCTGLLKLQEGRAKIALANQMLEAGQISDEDMKKVIKSLHSTLGI